MKSRLQRFLQRLLGFDQYLFVFSIFKIGTIRWDRGEKDFFFFIDLLQDSRKGLVLDVGANIGIMAYHLSKSNKSRQVICFEPVTENLRCLRRIKQSFKLRNLEIKPVAVGDIAGSLEMVMPEVEGVRKQGLSHTVEVNPQAEGARYTVDVVQLDSIMNRQEPIVGIKLDVENFEFKALKGAEHLLRRDKPIVYCELWNNENRAKCFSLMQELGYEIRILKSGDLVLFDQNQHNTQNFFFIDPVSFVI